MVVLYLRTLDIKEEWEKADNEHISCQQLAKVIAERLSELHFFNDKRFENERLKLIEDFLLFSEDIIGTVDEFDDLMDELYNWGDMSYNNTTKICWIKTF